MTNVTEAAAAPGGTTAKPRRGRVKCVVWDLDNTVWDGVLLEGGAKALRPGVAAAIRALDARGVLNSVASRNEHDAALRELERFGLAEYFLYPQINWNPKSESVARIAGALNIGLNAIAFVDDQEFEREEVAFTHPEVLCCDAAQVPELTDLPEFNPRHVTEESANRRDMYRSSLARDEAQRDFAGTSDQFLETLGMVFTINEATEDDLKRAEELTVRTNQLNSTGVMYSYEELRQLLDSPDHVLLMASLSDRYGDYGKIGLALAERGDPAWTLKLLLMSCRVMSRGVGTVLLNHVVGLAHAEGSRLRAEFVPTDRNRIMYITYRFAGFVEGSVTDGVQTLVGPADGAPEPPAYLRVDVIGREPTHAR
jgi:FkbH-like protein